MTETYKQFSARVSKLPYVEQNFHYMKRANPSLTQEEYDKKSQEQQDMINHIKAIG